MIKKFRRPVRLIIVSVCLLAANLISANAQTNFTILRSFTGVPDGASSASTLAVDTNFVFYGTTLGGGTSNLGTVFRLNSDGSAYRVIKSFKGSDGSTPRAGVILSTNGSLYGTTYTGGVSNFGTVFGLNSDGSGYAVLHSFLGGSDGKNPEAGLTEGSDGALYGTTYFANVTNRGTVFKINKDGNGYSILHTFSGSPDGQDPECKLIQGSDGALYGTTEYGGAANAGTVFTMSTTGGNYATIYSFMTTSGDGEQPLAGVIEGSDQMLYGTTYEGGSATLGTVFQMSKDGSVYNILRYFLNGTNDAERPDGELTEGTDGALYGATDDGASGAAGTIFKLNKDGSGYSVLRSFSLNGGDGGLPKCALVELSNGVFYGTTEIGGSAGPGGVFALSTVPLPPRVLSLSLFAKSNLIQFAATSVVQYDVQRSTNLSSWSTLTNLLSPTNGQFSYSDLSPPTNSAFYRLHQH